MKARTTLVGRLAFLAEMLARTRLTGKEADITWGNASGFCRTMVCDSSTAVRELGYAPRSLDEVAADAVAWLRAHGCLPARDLQSPVAFPRQ